MLAWHGMHIRSKASAASVREAAARGRISSLYAFYKRPALPSNMTVADKLGDTARGAAQRLGLQAASWSIPSEYAFVLLTVVLGVGL